MFHKVYTKKCRKVVRLWKERIVWPLYIRDLGAQFDCSPNSKLFSSEYLFRYICWSEKCLKLGSCSYGKFWELLCGIYSPVLVIQNKTKDITRMKCTQNLIRHSCQWKCPSNLPRSFISSHRKFRELDHHFFLIFCMNFDTPKVRKLTKLKICKENVDGLGGPQKSQNDPEMRF